MRQHVEATSDCISPSQLFIRLPPPLFASHHLPLNGSQAMDVPFPEALCCGRFQVNQVAAVLEGVAGAAAVAVVVGARVQHLAQRVFWGLLAGSLVWIVV